ncbi:CesD/SycD/LcrH family type III secretion system chaperone [Rouxiella sp. S1S-2]|uniref:SycD/LcrH family type III secretion system chaperone n=1 Tax=Rouxiella sp. S1S-2 TaxID=2653856 RepID=UPI0012648924|nr:SycD/LcrH family type III secretion system chaperone [Rouxiella sp. S1S-2]KAB7897030.1 CesD/SycD/LcrH family type III secretion system chaperone [Rouxiella sp. S1S-2]
MLENSFDLQNASDSDVLQHFFTRGGSLRMISDVADEDLQSLEAYASQLFSSSNFGAARNIYLLLSTLDHWNIEYLLALGLCHQRLKDHGEAISCFTRVATLKIDDPRSAFFTALSLQYMGCEEQSVKALNASIMWCGEQTQYQAIKDSAKRMLTPNKEEIS